MNFPVNFLRHNAKSNQTRRHRHCWKLLFYIFNPTAYIFKVISSVCCSMFKVWIREKRSSRKATSKANNDSFQSMLMDTKYLNNKVASFKFIFEEYFKAEK